MPNLLKKQKIVPVVEKLVASLTELADTVDATTAVLESKPNLPEGLLERVRCYKEIVDKQLEIVPEISNYYLNEDYEELSRTITRINSLSKFIANDAKEILGIKEGGQTPH